MSAALQPLVITAPAKVNLCLKILRRRSDGYHDLLSFAGFTAFGDQLTVCLAAQDNLAVTGPFAPALSKGSENLIMQALAGLRRAGCPVPPLSITLDKQIPVGGGLGGGSSDAGALLQALWVAIGTAHISHVELRALAGNIGADVAVCLQPGWQIMRATGSDCQPAERPLGGPFWCVLANPGCQLSTKEVFHSLETVSGGVEADFTAAVRSRDLRAIIGIGNDLQTPASRLSAPTADLLERLRQPRPGQIAAAMSGSGASCFALFRTEAAAAALSTELTQEGLWAVTSRMYG